MIDFSPEFTEIAGRKVRYIKAGEGPALILLHGSPGSIFQWKQHIPEFSKTNTVYAFDVPGFGHSHSLQGHERAMPFIPMFIKQFIEHFQIEKPAILGGSFGGLAAMDYALEFPNSISKLILMNSAGLGKEVGFSYRLLSLPFVGEGWRYLDYHGIEDSEVWVDKATSIPRIGKILAGILDYVLSPPSKDRLENTVPQNRLTPLRFFRYGIHPIFGQKRSIRRDGKLHRIKVPTLVMWGEKDALFPVSHAHKAYKRLANPYNVPLFPPGPYIFRGVGHWPPRERQQEFESIVKKFLAD